MKQQPAQLGLSGAAKAAVLTILLGDEISSEIFKYLDEEEIERISREISNLASIGPDQATEIMMEFHQLFLTHEYMAQGGIDYAKKLLMKALGPDLSKKLIDRVAKSTQPGIPALDTLQKVDPPRLAKLLQNENPQTIALILAYLNPSQAAGLVGCLTEEIRPEVIMRLTTLEQISPEIVNKIGARLEEQLQESRDTGRKPIGGVRAVADLLNRLDSQKGRTILQTLEARDPDLALTLRNLMFVFDDLLLFDDRGMREIIQRVDKKRLSIALKGTSDELRAQFFRQMSQRAVEMLKEDMEALGPIRLREVETAQREILNAIRELEKEGLIRLGGASNEEFIS
ncbi:MAG: flagellar motor switch protein FliG [Acidobacteria bacterium]|nr:flagellar motor switch protein FliG [Acidobacteriota bacterium]